MMSVALRGYTIWLINIVLCIYFFTQTFKISDYNRIKAAISNPMFVSPDGTMRKKKVAHPNSPYTDKLVHLTFSVHWPRAISNVLFLIYISEMINGLVHCTIIVTNRIRRIGQQKMPIDRIKRPLYSKNENDTMKHNSSTIYDISTNWMAENRVEIQRSMVMWWMGKRRRRNIVKYICQNLTIAQIFTVIRLNHGHRYDQLFAHHDTKI